jgi:hypothetical protein
MAVLAIAEPTFAKLIKAEPTIAEEWIIAT